MLNPHVRLGDPLGKSAAPWRLSWPLWAPAGQDTDLAHNTREREIDCSIEDILKTLAGNELKQESLSYGLSLSSLLSKPRHRWGKGQNSSQIIHRNSPMWRGICWLLWPGTPSGIARQKPKLGFVILLPKLKLFRAPLL